jgi:hypothetical protein
MRRDCLVVLADKAVCTPRFKSIQAELVRRGIAPPVIVVGPAPARDGEEVLEWASAAIAEREFRDRGWSAVRSEFIRAIRAAVLVCVGRRGQSSLEAAIEMLLTARPPIHSVAELARRQGFARDTLTKAWNKDMRGRTPLTLGDVVDIILELDAVEREVAHIGWRYSLKKHLGVRPERIERISQDIFSMSRDELCNERFLEAMGTLNEVLLVPLEMGMRNLARRGRMARSGRRTCR